MAVLTATRDKESSNNPRAQWHEPSSERHSQKTHHLHRLWGHRGVPPACGSGGCMEDLHPQARLGLRWLGQDSCADGRGLVRPSGPMLQPRLPSPAVLRLMVLSGFFLPADSFSFTLLLSVLALWKSSENILFLFAGHSSNTNLLNLISRCPKGTKGNEFRVLISDTPR